MTDSRPLRWLTGLMLLWSAVALAQEREDVDVGLGPALRAPSAPPPLPAETLPDDERVRHFASRLQLQSDGSLEVREQIIIWSLGRQFQHGIYRDLPTQQSNLWSGMREAELQVLATTLAGQPVHHRVESASSGLRIYLGDAEQTLPPGQHEYELRYRLSDQLQPAGRGSELALNVTGSNWEAPIDDVLIEFALAPALAQAAEPQLRVEDDFGDALPVRVEHLDGWLRIHHDQPLQSGVFLQLNWPQPLLAEVSGPWQRLSAGHRYAIGGVGLLTLYLLAAWWRVGRDPAPGLIRPLTELPSGQTPGMLRLLGQMAHDPRCFVADLLQLAVEGALRLVERDGAIVVEKTGSAERLALPLRRLHESLFASSDQVSLTPSNRSRLAAAVDAHRKALLLGSEGQYFLRNRGYWWPGVVIAVLTVLLMILQLDSVAARAIGAFMLVWLSGWSVGVYLLGRQVWLQWRSAQRWQHAVGALGMSLFALPFLIGELAGLGVLAAVAGVAGALIVVACLVLLMLFHHLIKAPTAAGRKLLDQADGLRLAIAQGHATAGGLDVAESLLPTALALDCAPAYAEQLQQRFGSALADGGRDWFQPAAIGVGLGVASWPVLAGELGTTLQSAIQRATVPRSRSSSSRSSFGSRGGGGRSGGGGGGW